MNKKELELILEGKSQELLPSSLLNSLANKVRVNAGLYSGLYLTKYENNESSIRTYNLVPNIPNEQVTNFEGFLIHPHKIKKTNPGILVSGKVFNFNSSPQIERVLFVTNHFSCKMNRFRNTTIIEKQITSEQVPKKYLIRANEKVIYSLINLKQEDYNTYEKVKINLLEEWQKL